MLEPVVCLQQNSRCIFKRFSGNLAGSCKHAGFCTKFRQLCSFFLVHRRFCSQGVHIPGVEGIDMKNRNLVVKLVSAISYLLKSSPLRIVSPANEFTCCLFSLLDEECDVFESIFEDTSKKRISWWWLFFSPKNLAEKSV